MAEFFVHLSQARHNESLAEYLLDKPYYDWAITACFYSAIHYFEARLFIKYSENDKKHSETSIPLDEKGEWKYTPHRWRERLVHDNFSQSTWISFRNLREKSELARYLSYYPKRLKVIFKDIPSYEIFQPRNAQHSVKKDLQVMANIIHDRGLYLPNNQFIDNKKIDYLVQTLKNLLVSTKKKMVRSKSKTSTEIIDEMDKREEYLKNLKKIREERKKK